MISPAHKLLPPCGDDDNCTVPTAAAVVVMVVCRVVGSVSMSPPCNDQWEAGRGWVYCRTTSRCDAMSIEKNTVASRPGGQTSSGSFRPPLNPSFSPSFKPPFESSVEPFLSLFFGACVYERLGAPVRGRLFAEQGNARTKREQMDVLASVSVPVANPECCSGPVVLVLLPNTE